MTDSEIQMLDFQALAELSRINLDVAKEAHAQVERRLSDLLDVKKSIEGKATALFGTHITLALAVFGVGGGLITTQTSNIPAWPFLWSGSFIIVGAVFYILAIWPMEAGALGSAPSTWLEADRIGGGDSALGMVLASLVLHHQGRIEASLNSNWWRLLWLRFGMACGIAAALVLVPLVVRFV